MKRRSILFAATSIAAATGARAQAAPIRILVGAPAGGTTDTMARTLATELGKILGRIVVVENKPGAGGNIAADAVAKAAPDGNTLLMSFTSHAINASLYPSLPFDPERDFTPLTMVSTSPAILVAHPSLPANDIKELVALAKARPGRLNFAIGSLGSSVHLAGEAFKMMLGSYIVLARRISDAAHQAVAMPEVQRRIANSPDEFARFVRAEILRWGKVVKFSGAKPE